MNAPISQIAPGRRGQTQFLLLALLFFAPLAAAYVLYFYFPAARPIGTTNYGELLQPIRELPAELQLVDATGAPLPREELLGRWTLVQRIAADCDEACAARLILSRQTRLALNEKRQRVQRAVIAPDLETLRQLQARLGAEHPDLRWWAPADGTGDTLTRFLDGAPPLAIQLLDPHGNYLMTYPAGDTQRDFKGMQKDLNKLLRLSNIG